MSWMPQTERVIFHLTFHHWHKWYCKHNKQIPNLMKAKDHARRNIIRR